ncbi:hypothetical protein [Streptomyces sp. TE33382]
MPRASASRSAACRPLSGPPPIAVRIASASIASTAARDHVSGPASGAGTAPVRTAHRNAYCGTPSRPAAWSPSYSMRLPMLLSLPRTTHPGDA